MRKNGQNWLIVIIVLTFSCTAANAQWREVRFPPNHMVSHVIATDDGRGMVFLTDSNIRVAITRDDWRTFDTVLLPKPEAPYVFEPFSYDTTANGTVVVVGQHRPPLVDLGWSTRRELHCNTSTAAFYSTDWGTSWTEVLPRQPGRYMSIAYRGRSTGVLLCEHDWKDSVKPDGSWYYKREYGRDQIVVDELMNVVSRLIIDTLTSKSTNQSTPHSSYCLEGTPKVQGFIDRINDSTLVMQSTHPCKSIRGVEDVPGYYDYSRYSVDVSTNDGLTWTRNFRVAPEYYPDYSEYNSMRLVNDTTWIDNQGFVYEGANNQARRLVCPNLPWGSSDWQFWETSATHQSGNLLWVTGDSGFVLPDSGGSKRHAVRIILFNPLECEIESSDSFEWRYQIANGDTLVRSVSLMPQLLRNGGAVLSFASVGRRIGTRNQLTYHWSIFVRDAKTTSSSDEIDGNALLLKEHNGIIFLPAPLHGQSQARYYSLVGTLVATVPIQEGASQTTVPHLPAGVYFVRIASEAPLKILVR